MSDEKNLNEENENVEAQSTEEVVEELVPESIEENADTTDEQTAGEEEPAYEAVAVDGDADIQLEENTVDNNQQLNGNSNKASKKTTIIAVVAAAVVVVGIVIAALFIFGGPSKVLNIFPSSNKYNREFVDVTGRTIEQVADQSGMDLKQFLEMYGLPEDMPADTYENAAYYSIPMEKIASKIYGIELSELREKMGIPDEIADDARWVDALDSLPLSKITSSTDFDAFKQRFNLGDDITPDTKYGEVRKTIDEQQMQMRIESEKQNAEQSDDNTENTPPAE